MPAIFASSIILFPATLTQWFGQNDKFEWLNDLSMLLNPCLLYTSILTKDIQFAKVILAGEVKSAVTVRGLRVTKGAKAAIEAAGGSVEE